MAGSEGIIRNEVGGWIGGYSRNIGISTSFLAELWALKDGFIKNFQLTTVDIELDAKSIVGLLANPRYSNNVAFPIVDDCKQLISHIPLV